MRALCLMDDPEFSLADVAQVVSLDPVLTARCLRLANTPALGACVEIASIGAAVVRLGAQEMRALLLTISVVDMLRPTTARLDLREVWRHAIASGVIARQLARDIGEAAPDRAYLAGLLHPLGCIIWAVCFGDRVERALSRVPPEQARTALEKEFGITPHHFCARVLERWNLPPAVVEAVEFQQDPQAAPTEGQLAAIVHTAGTVCRAFGLGTRTWLESPGDIESSAEWKDGVSYQILERACSESPESYLASLETVVESLGEILACLLSYEAAPGTSIQISSSSTETR